MTVSPITAMFSKAAATDVAFTVTSNAAIMLTSLKIGGSEVNASNYTYANSKLILGSNYLVGLAEGDKVFTLTFNSGDTVLVTVKVGA